MALETMSVPFRYLKHQRVQGDIPDFLKFYFAIVKMQTPVREIKIVELGVAKARGVVLVLKIGFRVCSDNPS